MNDSGNNSKIDNSMDNMNNIDNMDMDVQYDDDGNIIVKNKEEVEPEDPEDPLPEVQNPLKKEQIRKYLSNLTKTFSGMSYAFTTFNCSEKEIDEFNDILADFIHLRDVNISKNKIPFVKGIQNMTHLYRFDGRENDLREMSCFSDAEKFKFIQLLYLSQNKIRILPALYMDNLIELHLDNNQIKNATQFSVGLKKVKFINLSNNKLRSCDGISNCPNLEKLMLNDNEIKTFKGLENMPKLEIFEVSNNKIEKIDINLNFPKLSKINISGNQVGNLKEFNNLKFPNIKDLICSGNPCIDEVGGGAKMEMLIIFEGFDLKTVNEEEVVADDIKEAMEKKEERIRIAEEERIQREKEEAERKEVSQFNLSKKELKEKLKKKRKE